MGCLLSYLNPMNWFSAKSDAELPEEPKVYSWDQRKQVDPKDYTIENKNGETVIRMPGSVNGMQFIVQNLENCVVYIFDHIALISIDDCKNCKFFIGPSKGSIFIRDSSDCCVATMSQQFRARDCKRITTFLLCATQPIIESSTQMKFSSVSVNYDQLQDQLKKANLSLFINNWNNIHDFTPVPGEVNYGFLNEQSKMDDYIQLPEESIRNKLNLSFSRRESLIPYTSGTVFRPNNESCLIVLFLSDSNEEAYLKQEQQAKSIIENIKNNYSNLVLVQTKRFKFSETSSENVFSTKAYNNYLQKGPIIGLEFNGTNSSNICHNLVKSLRIDLVYVSQPSTLSQHQLDNFYNFAEMQMSV